MIGQPTHRVLAHVLEVHLVLDEVFLGDQFERVNFFLEKMQQTGVEPEFSSLQQSH